MQHTLSRISNWKYLLTVFLLFSIFSFILFPHYQARLSEAAGGPVTPLDTRMSYAPEEVLTLFDSLGTEGRDIYKTVVGIDMLYPIIYGLLFVLVLAWLLKKITREDSRWVLLALIPVIGVIFDHLENINTLKLLNRYPDISTTAVAWGEKMTLLKHSFGILSVGLAVLLAVIYLVKRLMHRNSH